MQDSTIHHFGPYSKALLRFARHQENQIRDKLQEPPGGFPVHRSYSFLLHNWNKSRADLQISNQIFWILYESWSSNLVTLAGRRRITTYFENVQLNHYSTRSQNIAIHSQSRSTRSVSSSKTSLTNYLDGAPNQHDHIRLNKRKKQSHRNIESVSKNAYLTYLKATAPESKLTTTTTSLFACFLLVVCCCCQREEKTISENQLPPWY
jgi:hypothetical protein